ncbi:uncharacterized protein [Palaemon carinicauda]|uniref:uncharacterized protein n=1 Tax=Palaemon carinicauda TaxID=392227 RepID=UPI0035B6A756
MVYDTSATLPRDINYVEGPQGQVVVVVQPNQRIVKDLQSVAVNEGYTLCAALWGFIAFPFTIIGFSLICVGLSRLQSDPHHPVLTVGLVFFIIGVVTTFLYCISMYCYSKHHNKRVARLMYILPLASHTDDHQSMLPITIEENHRELTPYQRFMLHRRSEQSASGSSNFGGQTPFPVPVASIPSLPSSPFQERVSLSGDHRNNHSRNSGSLLSPSSFIPSEIARSSNGYRILQSVLEEPPGRNDGANYTPLSSEVSLEDILSSVQSFLVSPEVSIEARTSSDHVLQVPSVTTTLSSGRESPYDNLFSLT